MEEEYTQEKMVDMLKTLRIDNFLIECLEVIDRDLIREGGVTNPARASDSVRSVLDVIEEVRKPDLCGKDVDRCLQKNIQYILRRPGVTKGVE